MHSRRTWYAGLVATTLIAVLALHICVVENIHPLHPLHPLVPTFSYKNIEIKAPLFKATKLHCSSSWWLCRWKLYKTLVSCTIVGCFGSSVSDWQSCDATYTQLQILVYCRWYYLSLVALQQRQNVIRKFLHSHIRSCCISRFLSSNEIADLLFVWESKNKRLVKILVFSHISAGFTISLLDTPLNVIDNGW